MRTVFVLLVMLGACAGQPTPNAPQSEDGVSAAQPVVAYASPGRAFRPEATWMTPAGYAEGENILIVTEGTVQHHFVAGGEFQPGIGYPATTVSSVALRGRVGRVHGFVSEGNEHLLLVFLCSDTDKLDTECLGTPVPLRFAGRHELGMIRNRLLGGARSGEPLGMVVLFRSQR